MISLLIFVINLFDDFLYAGAADGDPGFYFTAYVCMDFLKMLFIICVHLV